MPLFEYAVILEEKRNDKDKIVGAEKLIVPITSIMAKDQGQAQILAARAIPEEHLKDLDRITVAVRPF
jgi:hypothetical protein